MPKSVLLLFLIILQPSVGSNLTKSPTAGALQPLESECYKVQEAFNNVLYGTTGCMFVSTEHIDCPFIASDQPILAITMDQMFGGYVFNYQQTEFCENVVLFLRDFRLFRQFIRDRNLKSVFRPFTRVGIIATGQDTFDDVFDSPVHKEWILLSAISVVLGRIHNTTHYEIHDEARNGTIVFSNQTQLRSYVASQRNHLLHPLFDKNLTGRVFKVSLFHCPPHVIKLDDRMSLDSYDGAEMRFVKEVTRDWNVEIYDRHFLFDSGDTWQQVSDDVVSETTDIGMCSTFLTAHGYKRRVDVSNYFSYLCGTFLVPKPQPVTQASYIYLPLSTTVWWITAGTLLITTLLYYILSRLLDDESDEDRWEVFSRAFLDIINIVTSHGIPKVNPRIAIQLLVISWVILCLLLGTAYSTKYTSILTHPMYTKPVDNIQDFLDEGLFYGEVGERKAWMEEFRTSGDPLYIQLPSRFKVERDLTERLNYIPTGKYARFVKVMSNNYVTDTETFPELAHHLRLMKTCVNNYYTIFSFVKNSPYVRYFNRQLGRYIDAGFVDYWFKLMAIKRGHSYMAGLFDKHAGQQQTQQVPLNISNVIGAFIVLAVGLGLSTIVFFIEVLVYNRQVKVEIIMGDRERRWQMPRFGNI